MCHYLRIKTFVLIILRELSFVKFDPNKPLFLLFKLQVSYTKLWTTNPVSYYKPLDLSQRVAKSLVINLEKCSLILSSPQLSMASGLTGR